MNGFTKEELETLNTALSVYEKRLCGNESPTRFSSLLKMIDRMIDNYCDHEFKINMRGAAMNDFKVGDEVYFWEFSSAIGRLILTIARYEGIAREHEHNTIYRLSNKVGYLKEALFKSKSQAIDAMIARLTELRDEE